MCDPSWEPGRYHRHPVQQLLSRRCPAHPSPAPRATPVAWSEPACLGQWPAYLPPALLRLGAVCGRVFYGLEHVNHALRAIRSRTMLSVMNTPVRPTPALPRRALGQGSPAPSPESPALRQPHCMHRMGPLLPNCSLVCALSCWMKSAASPPRLRHAPAPASSVNLELLDRLDCPSWERWQASGQG